MLWNAPRGGSDERHVSVGPQPVGIPMNPLSDKTLEVLRGGTQGEWYPANMVHAERGDQMTPEEIGEYVANNVRKSKADGGFDHFLFITTPGDDSPDICHVGNGPSGPANARKIALVNPMARVCLDAAPKLSANARQALLDGLAAGEAMAEDADDRAWYAAVRFLLDYHTKVHAALANLEQEARKHG
jgi:hypothetical protein